MEFNCFVVEVYNEGACVKVSLNCQDSRNLLDENFWYEFPILIREIDRVINPSCVVLQSINDNFTYGLDVKEFIQNAEELSKISSGENREKLYQRIIHMQSAIKAIWNSPAVYIAVINGYCIGAGLDIISACDLRIGAKDAIISLREGKMGIVADLGSLTFLPSIIGISKTKLMAYSANDFSAEACYNMGLLDFITDSASDAKSLGHNLSVEIASNPPLALRGIKKNINYADSHNVMDSLEFTSLWNAAFLDSLEFREAITAFMEKRKPVFRK